MIILILLIYCLATMFWLKRKMKLSNKIYFSPAFIFCIAWSFSFILYLLGSDFIRLSTIINLMVFILSFVIPGLFLMLRERSLIGITPIVPISFDEFKVKPIAFVLLIAQGCALFAGVLYLYTAIQYAGFLALADVGDSMSVVRGVMAKGGYDVPIVLKFLGQLNYVNYIAPVAFLALWMAGRTGGTLFFMSLSLGVLYSIVTLERSGVLRQLIINGFVYVFLSENKIKALRNAAVLVLIVFVPVVYVVSALRGQSDEGGDNIYEYVVGALGGLDAFIVGTSGFVAILEDQEILVTEGGYSFGAAPVGLETATELYRLCNAVGACDVKIPNNKEYIYEPIKTNIYTGVRSFYQDFGPIGMPIAVGSFSIFVHFLFLRFLSSSGVFRLYGMAYLAYVSSFLILGNNFLLRDLIFTAAICAVLPGLGRYKTSFWWGAKRIRRRATGVKAT